jgi:hypothetical protein
MISIKIDVDDVNNLLDKAKQMQGVKNGVLASAVTLVSKLRDYPTQQPDTEYKRTGDLAKKWGHKTLNSGFTAQVGNNQKYMPYVQGDRQTKYFKKHWGKHSVKYVVKQNKPLIRKIVLAEVKRGMK